MNDAISPVEKASRFLMLYEIATATALANAEFAGAIEPAKGALEALLEAGVIACLSIGKETLYEWSEAGLAAGFAPEERKRLLNIPAILRAYGALSFCCLDRTPRRKISILELRESTNLTPLTHRKLDFFVEGRADGESTQNERFGVVYVDPGRDPRRIVRDMHTHVEACLTLPELAELAAEKRFIVGIVTSSEEKKSLLAAGFRRRPLPVRPHIYVDTLLEKFYAQKKPPLP